MNTLVGSKGDDHRRLAWCPVGTEFSVLNGPVQGMLAAFSTKYHWLPTAWYLLTKEKSNNSPGTEAELLVRDSRAATQLKDANIVAIYEVGHSGNQIYIDMRLHLGSRS